MAMKEIKAFILPLKLNDVKDVLLKHGIQGISISKVKGYGEYANYFSKDMTTDHMCICVMLPEEKVDEIVKAVLDAAHTGSDNDGILAIKPVERIYRIRTKEKISSTDLLKAKNN